MPNGIPINRLPPMPMARLRDGARLFGGGRPVRVAFEDAEPVPAMEEYKPDQYKKGEELFNLILSSIREIYGVDAMIAGGAVRDQAVDYLLHKDVDVFIPMKWDEFNFAQAELGWARPAALAQKPNPYDKGKEPMGFKVTKNAQGMVQGTTVDLVFLDKPMSEKDIKTFPIHAQRCTYTLADGLRLFDEAKADIDAKQFTIDPTIKDKERLKRLKKKVEGWLLRDPYKGWKLVDPMPKEWWEAEEKAEKAKPKPKSKAALHQKWWDEAAQLQAAMDRWEVERLNAGPVMEQMRIIPE